MARPTKACAVCGEPFERNPKYGAAQWEKARFCSNSCRASTLAIERKMCACGCGRRVSKAQSVYRPGHNPQHERAIIWQVRTTSGGKKRWVVPKRGGGHIAWARIVAWDMRGRELRPEEVVHHINGDSTDDGPENLQVFATHSEHMAFEYKQGRTHRLH